MAPLFPPLVAFVLGIFASPYLDAKSVWICLPLAVLLAFARRRLALLAVFLLGVGLRSHAEPPQVQEFGTEAARLEGVLTGAPERRNVGVYLDLRLLSVDGRPAEGRVRLTEFLDDPALRQLFDDLDLGSGDRVEILVALHRPAIYQNPGAFNFRRYLEREGIYWTGTIRNPRLISVLGRGWHGADHIRGWILSRVRQYFVSDPPTSGLVLGMTLGEKHELTADVERQFQAAGLYHLVVVSGFNLAVVSVAAGWLATLTARKRRSRLLIVLMATIAYAGLVGWQTPVVRAAVAACFLLAGKALDRRYAPLNALAGAALVILLLDPAALEDPSFQLTFATVLTVIVLGAPAARWAFGWLSQALEDFDDASRDGRLPPEIADWRVSRRLWCELHGVSRWAITLPWHLIHLLGEALIVSIAVETVLAYFMVESFYRLSPLSPLLNLPAGLIAAVVTPAGLALVALPAAAAMPVAWVIAKLVRLLIGIVSWTLTLPAASLRVPSAPAWLWAVYALVVCALVLTIHRRWRAASIGGFTALIALQGVAAFVDFSPPPPKRVALTFIDVGQGDSILAEFPDGRRMLIDGGGVTAGRFLGLREESTFSIGEDVVSRYLFSGGIRRLDAIVLTHAHNDHMDGLFDIVENFRVAEAWLGRNPMIPRYRDLLDSLSRHAIPIRWVYAGETIGSIEVLHPPRNWKPRKNGQNNDSVVLLIRAGEQTALLTGDLEIPLPSAPAHVNILKVPHHGSRGTKLNVAADVKIISVGAHNPFGHPDKSKLPALRTDLLGAITVTLGE
jgi:competence protein ComEC